MRPRFFPLRNYQSVLDRYTLILSEFKTYVPDTIPVREFMYLSDKAYVIREERKKAIQDGKMYYS